MGFLADNNYEGCDIATFVPMSVVGAMPSCPRWTIIQVTWTKLRIAARKSCLRTFWSFLALTNAVVRSLRPFAPKGVNRRFINCILAVADFFAPVSTFLQKFSKKLERQNAQLKAKLLSKDEVIAEIMASHVPACLDAFHPAAARLRPFRPAPYCTCRRFYNLLAQ